MLNFFLCTPSPLIVLYLPFLNVLWIWFINSLKNSFLLSTSILLSSFLVFEAYYVSYFIIFKEVEYYYYLSTCIDNSYLLFWSLQFDILTASILCVVTSISWVVHIYSVSYINNDHRLVYFLGCLSLFTFFILVLVTSASYFQLFVGWEGVGLCSFLLINFWHSRVQANKAALQALLVNKVGDFFFFIGILLLLNIYKTTEFFFLFDNNLLSIISIINSSLNFFFFGYWISVFEFITFCFFIAAIAKSAQIGFHTWLLSAIEGPTPVSALLHAATIVTAGVFLLLRSAPIFFQAPITAELVTFFGAITAFFAGICGLVQHDIKKIIALSTCSQLGYIFYACGLIQFQLGLFHLVTHAFFKALLFLCAGAIIHSYGGEQDLRRIGGALWQIPITYISIIFASLALIGFPFLSGFYSKDRILEVAWASSFLLQEQFKIGLLAYWITGLAAIFTVLYSFRLLYWIFFSRPISHPLTIKNLHEADEVILIIFRFLLLGSLFLGYFLKDLFSGISSDINFFYVFGNCSIINLDVTELLFISEFIPIYIKFLPLVLGIVCGIGLLLFYESKYYIIFLFLQLKNKIFIKFYNFLNKKWTWEIFYNRYIGWPIIQLAIYCYKVIDQGFLEKLGARGINNLLLKNYIFYNYTFNKAGFMILYIILTGLLFFIYLFF